MTKKLGAIACLLLLAACATATPVYAPDGRRGAELDCSGWARNWGMCYQKAGELCGTRGYDVLNRSEDTAWAFGSPITNRHLLVACHNPQ